jgi:hypothetical protein
MSYSLRCLRLAPAADRKSSAAASGIPSAGCLAFARKRMNSGKHGDLPARCNCLRRRASSPAIPSCWFSNSRRASLMASGKRAARWRAF